MHQFSDVMRGRLTFHGEVRREDHFLHQPVRRTLHQPVETDVARPHAIERRQHPHEDEVQPAEGLRLLHHHEVRRRLHHAQQRGIAPRRAAQSAHRFLGEAVALLAMLDAFEREPKRTRQPARTPAIPLQQVIRHALGGLRPDAGQATQRGDEFVER